MPDPTDLLPDPLTADTHPTNAHGAPAGAAAETAGFPEPYKAPPMDDARLKRLLADPAVRVYQRAGPLAAHQPAIRLVGEVDLFELLGRESEDGLRVAG